MRITPLTKANLLLCILVIIAIVVFTPSTPLKLTPPEKSNDLANQQRAEATQQSLNFIDRTLASGIFFSHQQGDTHLTGIDEILAPGACVLDFNNDGWMDLFLVNGSGHTRYYRKQYWWQQPVSHALYKNRGDGTFEDVSQQSGITEASWGMGCVSADFDNDGLTDLLVTNLGKNHLYKNSGQDSFVDVSEQSGLTGDYWSTSASVADYDGDGLLDIYVANYVNYEKGAKTYEGNAQYEGQLPVTFMATLYDAQPNQLFRNTGDFHFSDVTQQAGVADRDGRSRDTSWLDVNQDRYPDLFVINNSGGGSNRLYINQHDGTFVENATAMNLSSALGYDAMTHGDIDNDGDDDLIITSPNTQSHLLLINESQNAQHKFTDKAKTLGLVAEQFAGYSGWAANLADFNNDGWQDLFIVNGLTTPDPDTNRITQGQGSQFWLNQGDGTLKNVTLTSGQALMDSHSSRGAAIADFDNDGDLDIYIANNNDMGQLLTNQLSDDKNWLGIQLSGNDHHSDAIGTRVTVKSGTLEQTKTALRGNSFLSSNDPRLHFGFGGNDKAVSITIVWPNGETKHYNNVMVNRYLHIDQSKGLTDATSATANTTTESLALQLDKLNPQSRALYVQWLNNSPNTFSQLKAAIHDDAIEVRITATHVLQDQRSNQGMALLIKALEDDQPEVRNAAVQALRNYESEASIRWLLRMFYDESPLVRQSIADNFAFFYREEEAVIYRKYLAIPHLIKLIEDNDLNVRIAAIRALAEAERFRAVAPLVQLLNNVQTDSKTKAEAARALGLIREQRAIEPLLSQLKQDSSDAETKAQILIALKRLAYPQLDALLPQLLQSEAQDNGTGLEIIASILANHEDGVVIHQRTLLNATTQWHDTDFKAYAKQNGVEQQIEKLLNIVSVLGLKLPKQIQETLLSSQSTSLRAQAYAILIQKPWSDRAALSKRGLKDPALEVRNAVLRASQKAGYRLPQDTILQALRNTSTVMSAIIAAETALDATVVKALLKIAKSESQTLELRAAALNSASHFKGELPQINESLLSNNNSQLFIAALHYWNASFPINSMQKKRPPIIEKALNNSDQKIAAAAIEILSSRPERWARETLRSLSANTTTDESIRRHIIEAAAKSSLPTSTALLVNTAKDTNNPLRKEAMTALVPQQSHNIESLMWRCLKDSNEPEEIRFIAARALIDKNRDAVMNILQGQ